MNILLLGSSLLYGAVFASAAIFVVGLSTRQVARTAAAWNINAARQERLRDGNWWYRWFGPYIDELAPLGLVQWLARFARVQRHLDAGASDLPWAPDEYVAAMLVRASLTGAATAWSASLVMDGGARVLIACCLAVGVAWHGLRQLRLLAQRRMHEFNRRLPFAVDLLGLMMEAGASFRESLKTVVTENRNHPLGEELGKLMQEMERGQTLHTALDGFQLRMRGEEVRELVLAVQTADQLGTPLSQTFLEMADRIRLKRSQLVEKIAAQAHANITFPGMVIMLACLIIVVAPFILRAVYESNYF